MVRIGLFLFSLAGYYLLMNILFGGKRPAVYPAIFVSAVSVAGFFAGAVGLMQPVFSAIYWAGIALAPVCGACLWLGRKQGLRLRREAFVPFAVLCVGAALLYTVLDERFIFAYDDLAHWAKIARTLSAEMRFPLESDGLTHASYPLGSALFIAYVTNAVANREGIWLFAQGFMLLSYWTALLSATKKPVVQAVLALFLFLLMNYNITLEILCVDNLLAAAAFACLVICLALRDEPVRFLVPATLLLCALSMIKNSGIFMVVMIAAYAVILYRKHHHRLLPALLMLILPAAVLMIWNRYVDSTFTSRMSHRISVDYYQEIMSGKTMSDIADILRLMLSIIVNPMRNHVLWLVPGYAVLILAGKKQGWLAREKHVFVFAALMFVIYQVGMMLMYVFSMPMIEIIKSNGADYDRYNNTITAMLAALMLFEMCRIRSVRLRRGKIMPALGICAAMIAVSCLGAQVLSMQFRQIRSIEYRVQNEPCAYLLNSRREVYEALPRNSSYVVLLEDDRSVGYQGYVTSYYLYATDIVCTPDPAEARARYESDPGRYYVDVETGEILKPTETVGVELFPQSAQTGCTNALDTAGYKQNTRYSTSAAADVTAHHWDTTGYIPAKAGDVVRLQNVTWYPSAENEGRGSLYWYRADYSFKTNNQTVDAERLAEWNCVYDDAGNIIQFTVPELVGESTAYLRITCQDINENSVITVNEEIR